MGAGQSVSANDNAARKHFKSFYDNVYHPSNPSTRSGVTMDNIQPSEITDDLIGKFSTYLCQASAIGSKSNKLLRFSLSLTLVLELIS